MTLLICSVLGVAVGGCTVTGPRVEVRPPLEIKAEPAGTGKFCPPGQAKKGNC
jgi:hypothetical protein